MVKGIVNAFDHIEFCLVLNLTATSAGGKWVVIWPPNFATRYVSLVPTSAPGSKCLLPKLISTTEDMEIVANVSFHFVSLRSPIASTAGKRSYVACFLGPGHTLNFLFHIFLSLREIFYTDAGQLSDILKSFAGQNKYLQDCRHLCCQNIIFF